MKKFPTSPVSRFAARLALLAAMITIATTASSQYRVYLGMHLGKSAQFHFFYPDEQGIENAVSFKRTAIHGHADLRLGPRTYLHLGFSRLMHQVRYKVPKVRFGDYYADLTVSYNLQLGITRRFNLWRNRLFLVPIAGFEVAEIRGRTEGEYMALYSYGQEGVTTRTLFIWPFGSRFALFPGVGLSLQYVFDFGLVVSARAYYAQGLDRIAEGEVSVQRPGGPAIASRFYSRYSRLPIQLGFSYPVSRIWEGKVIIE